MTSNLVILDRDGVINRDSQHYVRSAKEWLPLPGSIEAISRLTQAGFVVTVASNQSGIGRGFFGRAAVYGMHAKLRRLVRAAGGQLGPIVFCPHHPNDGCACRKPRNDLLKRLGKKTGEPLNGSWLVGDSLRDLQAGQSVGCRLCLVRTGNGERVEALHSEQKPGWWAEVSVFDDLAEAADFIIEGH